MKKVLYSLISLITVIIAFSSCSSDNDDKSISESTIGSSLPGIWKTTYIKGYSVYNSKNNNNGDIPADEQEYVQFWADGKCEIWDVVSDDWELEGGTYTVSGNKILIFSKNGLYETCEVQSLSKSSIILKYCVDEDNGNYTYMTLTKTDGVEN